MIEEKTTIDEKTIIKMYCGFAPNKESVLRAINDALPYIEDPEISEIMTSAIRKITAMSQKAFSEIDLTITLDTFSA